jgi:hypothetical protein
MLVRQSMHILVSEPNETYEHDRIVLPYLSMTPFYYMNSENNLSMPL